MVASRKNKPSPSSVGRYLRRFTLENVRTFRSPVTLDFCHPDGKVAQWTVILGENGAGKTTVLQYLAGMMPVQDREMAKVSTKSGGKTKGLEFRPLMSGEDWLFWHAQNLPQPWSDPMKLKASIDVSRASASLETAGPSEFKEPFGLEFTFGHTPEGRANVQLNRTGARDLKYYDQFRVFGYGASRHVAGPSSPYLSSESFFQNGGSSPVSTLFHDDYPLISPEQWLLSLDHAAVRAHGQASLAIRRAYESARRCLTASLPDLREIIIAPYGVVPGQTPMTLLCKTTLAAKPVPFSALSIGYRAMAAWLTDFVKRMHAAFPNLEEPDNGPAVVLIDEFDLHMHPKWQREAMAALSAEFPNTQFIVTAHSPIVVQATEGNAKLIVLRRKERADGSQEVEVIDNPEFAAGWRVDQILESVYGMSARLPEFSRLMKRRVDLRQKGKLTKAEQRELKIVETRIAREAPPEASDASERFFANLQRALDRAEASHHAK